MTEFNSIKFMLEIPEKLENIRIIYIKRLERI